MCVEFLRHVGLMPVARSSASDALRFAPHADLIVTGVLLPAGVAGIEFLAHLKRRDRTKEIPVILLTACAWKAEHDRAVSAGCDRFLSKPCLPHVLAREIRRLLRIASTRPPWRRMPREQFHLSNEASSWREHEH
jgi:CheY-like chemotaxis protein